MVHDTESSVENLSLCGSKQPVQDFTEGCFGFAIGVARLSGSDVASEAHDVQKDAFNCIK